MTGDITATVSFTQKLCDGNERTNGDATGGIWKVILHDFDSSLPSYECPDGLKWHIHEKPAKVDYITNPAVECGLDVTGNHYDPTFGCGPASQHTGYLCDQIGTKSCSPKDDVTTCEMRDLSGKFGHIKFDKHEEQTWEDFYITNVDNFEDMLIVFHCGKPRVACGNFNVEY